MTRVDNLEVKANYYFSSFPNKKNSFEDGNDDNIVGCVGLVEKLGTMMGGLVGGNSFYKINKSTERKHTQSRLTERDSRENPGTYRREHPFLLVRVDGMP